MSSQARPKPPPAGVWCPAVTLFNPATDTIDHEAQAKWYTYLSTTGLTGLVILGTNAEPFLLTQAERKSLIHLARSSVPPNYPLIAGVSGHSTAQVHDYIADAHAAGANYALLLPPAYFGPATTPAVIERFYDRIAATSPLPIIIYNFPGVCNGVDLDSDLIARLARRNANIVGVKLTCGSVAKITRLAAVLPASEFSVFGGQSDFLLGGLAVGSAGCVAAFANVFPRAIVRVYGLYKAGEGAEALELQRRVSLAETPCKAGIASTKFAAGEFAGRRAGIEGAEGRFVPRHPYGEVGEEVKRMIRGHMAEVAAIEDGL
ncbi:dihydrodipicolinate synthase [Pseudovirgaria hyperparasitica]|uniref:Dihydrodipicolinate synthase n=1 Tax=Pseudovirgaria hyperparasitica TaxID=470096 RepID=A0A6A6WCE9_9PEZI|nr:dihydrodipicolinate synthase [Pseudovirgaria hyperparasitica]KAF2760512.1 dihydrodipicolinate synthase [Pseudovirgaria hyperparasitica]